MKECHYCHQLLPDDSLFCPHCGKSLQTEESQKTVIPKVEGQKSYRNNWAQCGVFLFLLALIGFDFLIATVIYAFGLNTKFVFMISLVLYVCAILCGVLSFVTDYQHKKSGYQVQSHFGIALLSIAGSAYIALLNLTSVILK